MNEEERKRETRKRERERDSRRRGKVACAENRVCWRNPANPCQVHVQAYGNPLTFQDQNYLFILGRPDVIHYLCQGSPDESLPRH